MTDPRMLEVELCGARVAARLASIGIERLEQLRGRDPEDVVHAVNVQAGRVIWTGVMPIRAMTNLIEAAEGTVDGSLRRLTSPPAGSSATGTGGRA